MESFSDINPYNVKPENSTSESNYKDKNGANSEASKSKIRINPDDPYYDMSGEKHLIIFNHDTYDKSSRDYYRKTPSNRNGSGEDVSALKSTFRKIGFNVDIHHNKTATEIWDIILELKETDFSAASCLCIAILTHGFEKGVLCAYDRHYYLSDVIKRFENHPTLAGKPKLFFVQACRGTEMDDGNRIAKDGDDEGYFVVPSHADFLIARSTVEDYLSYRDNRGSWLIQELCKAIQKFHDRLDILHIMTLVQNKVALGYATKNIDWSNKRQMPETTYTLTKFLEF